LKIEDLAIELDVVGLLNELDDLLSPDYS